MQGLLRTIHAWAGVTVCLVLAVLGVSGSLLVLKGDYLRLVVPEARQQAALDPASLGAAVEAVERQIPVGELGYIRFADPSLGIHAIGLETGGGAYAAADGAVLDQWSGLERFELWLFDLHHHLLMGDAGEFIAGICALAGVALIVTGIYIWLPAARSFAWRVWPRSGKRRDLLSNHRDLGILFAAPLMVLVLTGAGMIYSSEARVVLNFLANSTGGGPAAPPPRAGEGEIDWAKALTAAQAEFPDAAPRILSWPDNPGDPVSLRMRQPGEWHPNGRTVVYLDPATSGVLEVRDAHALSRGDRMGNAIYPLHAAFVGGRIYDAVSFLTGLALSWLGMLGAWTFITKRARRVAPRRSRAKPESV